MSGTSTAFWRFWTASTVSSVGSGVSTTAIPLIAMTVLGASNFQVGLITAAGYAATALIGLPAGVIVARFRMRAVQVTMDLFRAVVVLSIPLAAWIGVLSIQQLVIVTLAVGLANNLFAVANASFLPSIVPKAQLTSRNGLQSGTQAVTQLLGPSLGGVLVQILGVATISLDAVSYLTSAYLLGSMPGASSTGPRPRSAPLFQQMSEGLAYIWRHRIMRASLFVATSANFGYGALLAASPPFLLRTLGLPAGLVGAVMAAETIGSLVAAAITARLARAVGSARAILLATTFGATAALLIPLAVGAAAPIIFCLGTIGMAGGVTISSVLTRSYRQQATPDVLMTRVMASVRFISWGVIPFGSLLAGVLAQVWQPRAALLLCVASIALAPVSLWFSPVRRLRDLEEQKVQ